jgi:hypothetical protein
MRFIGNPIQVWTGAGVETAESVEASLSGRDVRVKAEITRCAQRSGALSAFE